MKFWINESSEVDNVIILTSKSIAIGSCDKESYQDVTNRLSNKEHPYEVLGKEDVTLLPLNKVQNIVSRSTDTDLDVKFKVKKEISEQNLDFDSLEKKADFLIVLSKVTPDHLSKTIYQQSVISAALNPLLSLIAAAGVSYLYFDKFRWPTIIIGGLWALFSLWSLYNRITNPPEITSWKIKGRYLRKGWRAIKTGFSYAFIALIAFAFAERWPDVYGSKSLLSHLERGELEADKVVTLIERGADVNVLDAEGDTVIVSAIYQEDLELVTALVDAGASLTNLRGDGSTALNLALTSSTDDIVLALVGSSRPLGSLTGVLHQAVGNDRSLEVLEALIDQGANIQELDTDGQNLLASALSADADYPIVEFVFSKGVSDDFMMDEQTPIDYAKDNERYDIVALLKGKVDLSESGKKKARSPFLKSFISENTGKVLGKRSKAMLALLTVGDEESKNEISEAMENTVMVKAVNSYINANLYPVYAVNCPKISPELEGEIQLAVSQYIDGRSEFIRAGKELVELNAVLDWSGKTVLSGAVGGDLESKRSAILQKFNIDDQQERDKLKEKCTSIYEKIS